MLFVQADQAGCVREIARDTFPTLRFRTDRPSDRGMAYIALDSPDIDDALHHRIAWFLAGFCLGRGYRHHVTMPRRWSLRYHQQK